MARDELEYVIPPRGYLADARNRQVIYLAIIVVLLIVVTSLAIALGVANSRGSTGGDCGTASTVAPPPPNHQRELCTSPHCLLAASWMHFSQNDSTDPCEDFYQYACGGWESWRRHFLSDFRQHEGALLDLINANRHRLEMTLLSDITTSHDQSYERKLKELYQACVNLHQVDQDGGQWLRRTIIEDLGGWYVFNESALESWNMNNTLTTLYSKFLAPALFTIELNYDPENFSRNAIDVNYTFLLTDI